MSILLSATQIIHDLEWIITNQSLLNDSVLNELKLTQLTENQKTRISQAGVVELKSRKLGFYFETFIKTYINVSESYNLKAFNLQVQSEKQTIGEFDFIVENINSGPIFEHWEVSCKFYLCSNPELGLNGCSGTLLKDVFQRKLDRMKNHQLVLGATEFGKVTLQNIGVGEVTPKGLLKGMVFYHPSLGGFENSVLNQFHQKGIWMYFSEWNKELEGQYFVLEKPFLFSLNSYSSDYSLSNAETALMLKNRDEPVIMAKVNKKYKEQARFWLIPDGWFAS